MNKKYILKTFKHNELMTEIAYENLERDINTAVATVINDLSLPLNVTQEEFEDLVDSVQIIINDIYSVKLTDDPIILDYMIENFLTEEAQTAIREYYSSLNSFSNKDSNTKSNRKTPAFIQRLLDIPQPEQKSQQWLDDRQNKITASVFGEACGIKGLAALVNLLLDKISYGKLAPFNGNKATQFGERYEDVAKNIYMYRNNTYVYEFGMIAHPDPDISFVAASTDGVSDKLINLEIKCPSARVVTGIPPVHYWAQTQVQMAVLDLDVTHFLECSIMEYVDEEAFLARYDDPDEDYVNPDIDECPLQGDQITFERLPTCCHREKGMLIELVDLSQANLEGQPKTRYIYSPIEYVDNRDKLVEWRDQTIRSIVNSHNLIFIRVIPWALKRLSCVEIKRDRDWFNSRIPIVKEFWRDVTTYRAQKLSLEQIGALQQPLLEKYGLLLDKVPAKPRINGGAGKVPYDYIPINDSGINSNQCLLGGDTARYRANNHTSDNDADFDNAFGNDCMLGNNCLLGGLHMKSEIPANSARVKAPVRLNSAPPPTTNKRRLLDVCLL